MSSLVNAAGCPVTYVQPPRRSGRHLQYLLSVLQDLLRSPCISWWAGVTLVINGICSLPDRAPSRLPYSHSPLRVRVVPKSCSFSSRVPVFSRAVRVKIVLRLNFIHSFQPCYTISVHGFLQIRSNRKLLFESCWWQRAVSVCQLICC